MVLVYVALIGHAGWPDKGIHWCGCGLIFILIFSFSFFILKFDI